MSYVWVSNCGHCVRLGMACGRTHIRQDDGIPTEVGCANCTRPMADHPFTYGMADPTYPKTQGKVCESYIDPDFNSYEDSDDE